MKKIRIIRIIVCLLFLSSSSYAELINRGGGLIYDNDLDITWLQDANHSNTIGYDDDLYGYDTNGMLTWTDAMDWASNLVYQGYDDWRLPTTLQPDSSCSEQAPVSFGSNCTGSEMGHLYYSELGNLAGDSDINVNLFINIQAYWYWSSTVYAPDPNYAMGFSFYDIYTSEVIESGYQATPFEPDKTYAWAVRNGDSAPVIPEPMSSILFTAGGATLGLRQFWKKRNS